MACILVFDSGVGSIPIAEAIRERLPGSQVVLVADSGFFPYGEKTEQELNDRIANVLQRAVDKIQPDVIVLACNTASTIALEQVREQFHLPVVGVVPAIKPAAETSSSHTIGVIATPATIERDYTYDLINQFAPECEVVMKGSSELVKLAESWAFSGKLEVNELAEIISPFQLAHRKQSLDTLVLGCTHFPLLSDPIQELLPGVRIIDSSDAIGKQVKRVLSEEKRESQDKTNQQMTMWLTGKLPDSVKPGSLLSKYKLRSLDI